MANKLKELGYKTSKGNDFRYNQAGNIIKNEKYVGHYLGQKTYIVSPLTHKRNRNFGEKENNELTEDEKRLYGRNQARKGNYNLNQTAVKSGVKT